MSARHVDLYRVDGPRTPRYVRVDLMDVRAANTLVIHYDLERDGWAIESPTKMGWEDGEDLYDERLEEVAFVPAYSAAAADEVDRINGRDPRSTLR
jgi:hypothetical protein